MKGRLNNLSIESFLVMTLLVVFAVAMSIVIVRGSDSYQRLLDRKENQENARIAISYVSLKFKQNDRVGDIKYQSDGVEGNPTLVVKHSGKESAYSTYIYHYDGYLRSCYTDKIPLINLSEVIVPLEKVSFELVDELLTMEVTIKGKEGLETIVRYISQKSDGIR